MPTIHRAHGSRFGSFDHPDRYDRWASRFFGGLYERVAADVAAAGLPDGARVLDVGTGPGRVPLAIARALPGLRVEGLDLSTEMVAQARRNATDAGLDDAVRFTVGDVADLPYADATFDLVVSTMSQHHWADAAPAPRSGSTTCGSRSAGPKPPPEPRSPRWTSVGRACGPVGCRCDSSGGW